MNNTRRGVIGALLAIAATAIPGVGQAERVAVDIRVGPPPDRVEVVPAPRRGYVWAPGYYRWGGRRHVWVSGRWIRERRGREWVPHRWEQQGERWRFEEGHWR
jgi:hypothetical protein